MGSVEELAEHQNILVHKPWGDEYLAYVNDRIAIWCLRICPNKSTSLHSHLKKKTSLILLDGRVDVQLGFYGSQSLCALDKLTIRPGLFHATTCLADSDSLLFEIETPVDKHDLVRLSDEYGREKLPYEGKEAMSELPLQCPVIQRPIAESVSYQFGSADVKTATFRSVDDFLRLEPKSIIVLLSGGVTTFTNQFIVGPGDVVYPDTLLKIGRSFQTTQKLSALVITRHV